MMTLSKSLLSILLLLCLGSVALAQDITVGDACIALESHAGDNEHSLLTASVSGTPDSVRLYFRRLDIQVEDFYWVEMVPASGSDYWGIFPDPQDLKPIEFELVDDRDTGTEWADWWMAKESSDDRDPNQELDAELITERASMGKLIKRTWMTDMSAGELQDFLESLENQPAEYFVAKVDADGVVLDRSDMNVARVQRRCGNDPLTDEQEDASENLKVGETAAWQIDKSIFGWECDHIDGRIGPDNEERSDSLCGAAVIWWAGGWIPGAAAALPAAFLITDDDDPPLVSPSLP